FVMEITPTTQTPFSVSETFTLTASAITRRTPTTHAEPYWDSFTSATTGGWTILLKQTLRLKKVGSPTTPTSTGPKLKLKLNTNRVSNGADGKVQIVSPTPLFRVKVNAARRNTEIHRLRKSEVPGIEHKELLVASLSRTNGFGFSVTEYTVDGQRALLFSADPASTASAAVANGAKGEWEMKLKCTAEGTIKGGVQARLYFLGDGKRDGEGGVLACDLAFSEEGAGVSKDVLLAAVSGYLMLGVEEVAKREVVNRKAKNDNLFCGLGWCMAV
ncbi:hypothetical protein HK096_001266, partial [Nowakowskiella sp. JEL0078]